MKIGLVSSIAPLVDGGGRFIVEWLASKLSNSGHQVETVFIPFVDDPASLLRQMTAFRMLNLDACDRVITFRPPAHLVQHPYKIVWFIHHLRSLYDLWDTPYCNIPHNSAGEALRAAVHNADTRALREARHVFTNSQVVRNRLKQFNGIEGKVVYPPLNEPERFACDDWGDEIVIICRVSRHKRQHLAIEAMKWVRTPVRLRIAGTGIEPEYMAHLKQLISDGDLNGRVSLEYRWISEDEKAWLLRDCLATVYPAFDEDSYGYPTIEAAHARKATIGLSDGGGVSEFVVDGINGFVVQPEPQAIAAAFDRLWADRALARQLVEAAHARIDELNINWDTVLRMMLS
jgi:glycosyltransferase involved in cell wall biosynthesis